MAGFVYPHETEVAILAYLAVLGTVDDKWFVACLTELGRVRVVDL